MDSAICILLPLLFVLVCVLFTERSIFYLSKCAMVSSICGFMAFKGKKMIWDLYIFAKSYVHVSRGSMYFKKVICFYIHMSIYFCFFLYLSVCMLDVCQHSSSISVEHAFKKEIRIYQNSYSLAVNLLRFFHINRGNFGACYWLKAIGAVNRKNKMKTKCITSLVWLKQLMSILFWYTFCTIGRKITS